MLILCFFITESHGALSAYLYGPITALIIINTVFFALTIIMLYRDSKVDNTIATNNQQVKQKYNK